MKETFPVLQQKVNGNKLVYLDNAATTQKPASVVKALRDYYESYNANVHRSIHQLGEEATARFEEARGKVGHFINCSPEEVVFTSGTTESINLAARMLESLLEKGDEIILTKMEHHSNIVPWQQLAKRTGVIVKYVELTKTGELDYDNLNKLLSKKTKIVAVAHASNVLGTINYITEITKTAHKFGAVVVVDGAQAVPHMKVDVRALDCDFYCFSGHKMYGPTGIGVLYGKRELLQKLEPVKFGGEMIERVTLAGSTWKELPYRLEAGTPNIAGAIALGAAVDFLDKNMNEIEKHEEKVIKYGLDKLKTIKGLNIIGPEKRVPLVSFTLEGVHAHDLADFLNQEGIALRAGHHCAMPLMQELGLVATARASFACYNSTQEIDRLVEAIKQVQAFASENANPNAILDNLTEEQEIYKEEILDHNRNPHNYGKLKQFTFKQTETNSLCGDNYTFYLKLDNKNKIEQVGFEGTGCAISKATASMLSDKVVGMSSGQALGIKREEVREMIKLPLGPVRLRCALLPLRAVQRGIENHEQTAKMQGVGETVQTGEAMCL